MNKILFKTLLLTIVATLWGSSAWAEDTIYERGTTTAWTDADLADWAQDYCTATISDGLFVTTTNGGWTCTKSISVTENSIVTLEAVLKTGGAPGRSGSYDYVKIGGVTVGFNEQDKKAFVVVNGTSTDLELAYTRAATYNIQIVIDQATGAVSYTVDDAEGTAISTTAITDVVFGHNKAGRENYAVNPILQNISVSEVKQTVSTADYTLNYVAGETIIKTETLSGVIGNPISLTSTQKANFTQDEVTYIYESDDADSKTILADGTTVVNLTFHVAATWSYSVVSSLGTTLASGSIPEGNSVTETYPRWELSETTLYSCGSGTIPYSTTFTPNEDYYVKTITYDSETVSDVVFYTEGEDVVGASVGNNNDRASKGQMGYTGSIDTYKEATTLSPGKYKIYMRGQNGNSAAREFNFKVGESVVFTGTFANGSNTDLNSDEFTIYDNSTLSFASEGSSVSGIDYFYVVKTGEYEPPTYTLTLFCEETKGSINVDPITEGYIYAEGTQVNLTAVPADNYQFASWVEVAEDGAETPIEATAEYTVTMTKNIHLKATFEQKTEQWTWSDFAVNLTDAKAIPTTATQFGVKVAEDGSNTAVAADDATANFTVNAARFNDSQHGWVNCVFTIPVEGAVKIELGDCQYGEQSGTIVDAEGNSTDIKANTTKTCWSDKAPHDNVVVAYYAGTSATTLTVTYNGYCPFIAVTSIDPADIPNEATVTFDVANASVEGVAPAAQKVEVGSTVTIPANTTLYMEGYTLHSWMDATGLEYGPGDMIVVNNDITLSPVFLENNVGLADRNEAVTVTWQFGPGNGAGTINGSGIFVTQATVGSETIDVKMDIDASSGKFNNVGRSDKWAQVNGGTKVTIPSCKGATVELENYSVPTGTTIDGQEATIDETAKTASATITSTSETIDVVAGNISGSYWSYLTVVLPVPAATTYTLATSVSPQEAGTITSEQLNDQGEYAEGTEITLTATANEGYEFVNWARTNVTGDEVLSTENPYTFTIAESMTLIANFKQKQDEATVIYSWEGNAEGAIEEGGESKATDETGADLTGEDINFTTYDFYAIRLRGAKDFSTKYVEISLDEALKAGDKIAITAFRSKGEAGKKSGALVKFEKGSTNVSTATYNGLEFVNINSSAPEEEAGETPNTITLTVPEDADGSKVITLTRAETGTNLFITKLVISGERGGDEPEPIKGDVNGDQSVTVSDGVLAVSIVLENIEPTEAQKTAADMDNNETVDISDVVLIVDKAIGDTDDESAAVRSAGSTNNYMTLSGADISLSNTTAFAGFQMDVTLAEGAQLNGVELAKRADNLSVAYNRVDENTYRILAVSFDLKTIEAGNGALLSLDIDGNSDMSLSDVKFVDTKGNAYAVGLGYVTGISSVGYAAEGTEVYTVGGVKSSKLNKGLNVVRNANGEVKKVYVK